MHQIRVGHDLLDFLWIAEAASIQPDRNSATLPAGRRIAHVLLQQVDHIFEGQRLCFGWCQDGVTRLTREVRRVREVLVLEQEGWPWVPIPVLVLILKPV